MLKNLDQALEKEIKELKGAGEGHAEELSRASSVAETSKEELSVSFFLSFFRPGVAILEYQLNSWIGSSYCPRTTYNHLCRPCLRFFPSPGRH